MNVLTRDDSQLQGRAAWGREYPTNKQWGPWKRGTWEVEAQPRVHSSQCNGPLPSLADEPDVQGQESELSSWLSQPGSRRTRMGMKMETPDSPGDWAEEALL